mmetsp:Transcript_95506/g.308239  ORF Transcript_95506/g.308239 Transcript_95506/m.308239 type:complete len:355 (-) Transcript_95506:196-1260(-)
MRPQETERILGGSPSAGSGDPLWWPGSSSPTSITSMGSRSRKLASRKAPASASASSTSAEAPTTQTQKGRCAVPRLATPKKRICARVEAMARPQDFVRRSWGGSMWCTAFSSSRRCHRPPFSCSVSCLKASCSGGRRAGEAACGAKSLRKSSRGTCCWSPRSTRLLEYLPLCRDLCSGLSCRFIGALARISRSCETVVFGRTSTSTFQSLKPSAVVRTVTLTGLSMAGGGAGFGGGSCTLGGGAASGLAGRGPGSMFRSTTSFVTFSVFASDMSAPPARRSTLVLPVTGRPCGGPARMSFSWAAVVPCWTSSMRDQSSKPSAVVPIFTCIAPSVWRSLCAASPQGPLERQSWMA